MSGGGGSARETERKDRKSEARGQNVSGERHMWHWRLLGRLFPRFFAASFRLSRAAKLDISRAIKSNLLRKRPVPSARVISMASTSEWRAWESEQTIPLILNAPTCTLCAGELYFQHLFHLLLPLALHSRDQTMLISGCVIHREINVLDPSMEELGFFMIYWCALLHRHCLKLNRQDI